MCVRVSMGVYVCVSMHVKASEQCWLLSIFFLFFSETGSFIGLELTTYTRLAVHRVPWTFLYSLP